MQIALLKLALFCESCCWGYINGFKCFCFFLMHTLFEHWFKTLSRFRPAASVSIAWGLTGARRLLHSCSWQELAGRYVSKYSHDSRGWKRALISIFLAIFWCNLHLDETYTPHESTNGVKMNKTRLIFKSKFKVINSQTAFKAQTQLFGDSIFTFETLTLWSKPSLL